MSRSRPFTSLKSSRGFGALIVVAFAVAGLALTAPPAAPAQFGGQSAVAQDIKIKSPTASQVFQRDGNGRGVIPIALDDSAKDATLVDAGVVAENQDPATNKQLADRVTFFEGKLVGVPVGGPYRIRLSIKKNNQLVSKEVGPVFVGDLWVLAGQSNMEGVGDVVDVTPPHPLVMSLGMNGKWARAEEPLHWLVDSPDPVHSGNPSDRARRSAEQHRTRAKGAGLGLPFAVALVEQTRVPIGLVACAHGGTSMEQWNPAKKNEGGNSLYGSFLRQVQLAGGKVKGVLWYQGESDANGEASKIYHRVFADFIASVRADLNQSDLPFYYVQIGRFINNSDPKGWNAVQEAQRRLPERVPNTAVISVIDLELDDLIHVGTHGLKRAGARLARIAERELFGQIGATTPTLDRVSRGSNHTLIVKFKGVNMRIGNGGMAAGMGMGRMSGMSAGMSAMRGAGGAGGGGVMPTSMGMAQSPGEPSGLGLSPERHIAGFSIRKEDGTPIPLIFEAAVGKARDAVVLKLTGPVPEKAFLWYGYGLDPYCNLIDGADMAVPVFGPITLDEVPDLKAAVSTNSASLASSSTPKPAAQPQSSQDKPAIKLLIITGDHGHDWKATTQSLKEILSPGGKIAVDVTTTPAKDLTDANLAKYDVLLLNYKDTRGGAPETKWSDANKEAFLKAVRDGKGLVVFHFASSAFTSPNWTEFEKAIAGGWRNQGFHGPKHKYTVKKTTAKHPISDGLPAQFEHTIDELYQNSVMVPGNIVLATAYSDPNKPRGTGKDEPVIWVNNYGKGRVYVNALGHDVEAMSDPNFHAWIRRGVIWAATGDVRSDLTQAEQSGSRPFPRASFADVMAQTRPRSPSRVLDRSTYLDKMKAGWIGQMAGVGFGGPTEFRHQGEIVPENQLPKWTPGMINQFDQDDLYVEMTFLRTLEQHGLGVSSRQAGIDFANSRYPLWHANKAGRDLLRKGIAPPDSGHPALNDHADDIDYQIEADFSGLIAPGLPNTVIALGETFGRLMNAGDGLYGGQFVGAMYAEAFFETDMTKIIQAGLAAIPGQSQYHECISDVLNWYKEQPNDWQATWSKINDKYHKNLQYRRFSCSKNETPPYKFNIDAKLNGAYVVMGLLYGHGDPDRTITIATRCGQDSDCNPANAAGILFTTIGYSKLPERFTSGLDTTKKFNSTPYTFPQLIAVCEQLADQAVRRAGGRIDRSADGHDTYMIPVQAPRPGALASCWNPGPRAESRFSQEEMAQIHAAEK